MTVVGRLRQQRGFPISQGGFGSWIGDPSVIPPPSAFSMGTAGVVVNERTVLSLMVVSSCIRILGDVGAQLTPHVFRMKGLMPSPEDKEVDPPRVIAEPYADIDREEGDFRRIASYGLNGNSFSHVVLRDEKTNLPEQVEVLNPSMIKVEMRDGRKIYRVGTNGRVIPSEDIIHKTWLSLGGGLVGLNPIELGVNGFGIPIAAEQYAGRYFAQGMHPSGILSLEKPLRPEDKDRLEKKVMTDHGGLAQSHTPIILDSAAKWQQITITPETAQLLQSRSFSRGEIAGFYGVPNFLVGDTPDQGGPWGKGLQEMVMGFAIFSLSGYTGRLDRADSALLSAGYYVKRDVRELFKTNDQARGQYVSMLRQASVISPNMGLELIGMATVDEEGADSVFAPVASAHSDFLAANGEGAETGLPESKNPKGVPTGSSQGGQPPVQSKKEK